MVPSGGGPFWAHWVTRVADGYELASDLLELTIVVGSVGDLTVSEASE